MQVPTHAGELSSQYDLTISHFQADDPRFAAFDGWLADAAAEHGLSCGLIHNGVVHDAIHRLEQGSLAVGFHLDFAARWDSDADPYARLAEAVQDAAGHVANLTSRSRAFTDRAALMSELRQRGLGVPATVLVRPWHDERPLTVAQEQILGLQEPRAGVSIKPANGLGGVEVRLEQATSQSISAALRKARRNNPRATLLVQRAIAMPRLLCEDGYSRPAAWRLLYCLGEWLMVWRQERDAKAQSRCYSTTTLAEVRRHRLQPVLNYARDLAELSGLNWFSTDLCLSEGAEVSCHAVPGAAGREWPVLADDALSLPSELDVRSRCAGSLPDDVVRRVAHRFAEAAWRIRQQAIRPQTVRYWRAAA
jgi:hypothetical protein